MSDPIDLLNRSLAMARDAQERLRTESLALIDQANAVIDARNEKINEIETLSAAIRTLGGEPTKLGHLGYISRNDCHGSE